MRWINRFLIICSYSELAEDLKRTISRKIEKYSSSDKQFLSKTQSSSLQYAPKTLRHNYDYKKSERNEKKLSKVFTATHSLQFYKGDFYIDHLGEPNTEVRFNFFQFSF